jgi:hypothetical protein
MATSFRSVDSRRGATSALLLLALVVLLLPSLALVSLSFEESPTMPLSQESRTTARSLPPIDLAQPKTTETATFALG